MVTAISVPGPEKVPPHLRTHFTELKGAQVKVGSYGGNVKMKNLYDKKRKIHVFFPIGMYLREACDSINHGF
jgi:hypothetical protein